MKKWLFSLLIVLVSGCALTNSAIKDVGKQVDKGDYLEAAGRSIAIPFIALFDVVTLGTVGGVSNDSLTYSSSSNNSDTGWAVAGALLSGATQAALTPGNSASKVGAGLMGASNSMLNSTANLQADNSGIGNYGSSSSSGSQAAAYPSGNSNCPVNFNHLSANMPAFSDPMLSDIRQSILATSMAQIVSGAKQQGMSQQQTIGMAMRQADEFENTARQNAAAAAEVSTYLTPRAIVIGVNRGSLSLSLPCSGSPSMVEAAECAVIQQVWGAMANREIAKQIDACW